MPKRQIKITTTAPTFAPPQGVNGCVDERDRITFRPCFMKMFTFYHRVGLFSKPLAPLCLPKYPQYSTGGIIQK